MSDKEKVYCICRSSGGNRFMIGCDNCEEWYHGDCIHVTAKEAKYIKRYYCKKCRSQNPKLHIQYKSKYKDLLHARHKERHHHSHGSKEHRKEPDEERASRKEEDHNRKRKHVGHVAEDAAKKTKKVDSAVKVELDTTQEKVKTERADSVDSKPSVKKPDSSSKSSKAAVKQPKKSEPESGSESANTDVEWKPTPEASASTAVKNTKDKAPASAKKRVKSQGGTAKAIRNTSAHRQRAGGYSSSDASVSIREFYESKSFIVPDAKPRQCFGHKCKNAAKPGYKYCSDNCGISLATLRILQTLPDRIREWNLTPCIAEQQNRKELEKVRAQQDAVRARLEKLNIEFRQLEDLITMGKRQPIKEEEEEDEDVNEMTIHCVTCGSDIQTGSAIRHMERCYNKIESQTSFASKYKTQIDDARMFCDYYNPKEDSYCKRLKVLCPEHNPDPKVSDSEVCGCPVQKGVRGPSKSLCISFKNVTEFCRVAKKLCQCHYGWEKLMRAQLDMEKVKQWMKVDELIEQERQIKSSMSNRAGLLALLLHSTFNHEMEERLQEVRAQQMQKQQGQQPHPAK